MEINTINDFAKEVVLKSQLEILIKLIMKANLRKTQRFNNRNNGHLAH